MRASGVSRRLFYAADPDGAVLENSTACERRDPVTDFSLSLVSTRHALRGVTFEHNLEAKTSLPWSAGSPADGNGQTIFTESLILAQDERWRRA